jgi:RNA polymerase sigma factor (sigma-70 family)
MDQMPDITIIRGILEHKSRVIQHVYKEYFPMIERMVINSGGDQDQAKDIFQEGWIILYRKISKGEFELTCKLSTYLYAVCKKLWLQEKRKKISRMRLMPSEPDIMEESEPVYNENNDRIKQLFYKHFKLLSKDCQKMLILHFNNAPIEEIQKIMNYQSAHYAMDRKYRCKKSLMQRIINDPNFKSVQNEYSEQIRSVF